MILIFESPDNCGKDTQIKKIVTWLANKNQTSHVLHYSNISGVSSKVSRNLSEIMYGEMFSAMWGFADLDKNLILNRSHIGESVYSPMYRNYDGDYVFDLEKSWSIHRTENIFYLIMFIDEPENLIERDDGLSFTTDTEKKRLEIQAFKRAFQMSHIKNKLLINISNKSIDEVHTEIISFIQEVK